MALPLAKLGILVGAGIVGSVLAKEGGRSTISDVVSGAFRVFKKISHDDAAPSSSRPRNDSLLAQVNILRQELQLLASNRSVTIVTSTGSGSGKYGIVIITIVVGSGYVWWKGWKLPDMMFATVRSLSDARNEIAKQLGSVYESITTTRTELSGKIKSVECTVDECANLTVETGVEVSKLQGDMKDIGGEVRFVKEVVETLESKFRSIEEKQTLTNDGVRRLVNYAWTLENSRSTEQIQAAPSVPALELPQHTAISRTGSLPPIPLAEPQSPSPSNGSHKKHLKTASSASTSGLKDISGSSEIDEALSSPDVSNRVPREEKANNGSSSAGIISRKLSGLGAAFLTRTFSSAQP